jgi:hypothetical protein
MTPAPQRHLEVRGEHPHFIPFGLDQHIGQDRNRVLPLHDPLEKLQFSQKLILPNDEFHGRVVTSKAEWWSAFTDPLLEEEKR